MTSPGTAMVPVTISQSIIIGPREPEDHREPEERTATARGVPDNYMLFNETDGARKLYISVGEAEAVALAFTLQGVEIPRPMTYQFAAALLAAAGSGVREIRITSLIDGVFYAQAVLTNGAVVDARPSDAVNLAAITGAPVYVASELLDLPTEPPRPAR